MPRQDVIKVTRDELDSGRVPTNFVLCKVHYDSEGLKSKGGLIIGISTDLTYQDSENLSDDSSHIADFAETSLIVYRTPDMLYFEPNDPNGMDWETEIELQVGDLAFTNPIEALNSVALECEGERYCFIPYSELYVAKRTKEKECVLYEAGGFVMGVDAREEVITLNGYVLLEPIYHDRVSQLDVTSEDKIDKTRGKVRFIGKSNKRYRREEETDFQDLQVGDVVLLDKKATPFWLERKAYNSFFSDKGELFFVVQRRKIAMVLERVPGALEVMADGDRVLSELKSDLAQKSLLGLQRQLDERL